MGQYWLFQCLDNHQTTDYFGKLGEIIYSEHSHFPLNPLLLKYPKIEIQVPTGNPKLSAIEKLPVIIRDRICAYTTSNPPSDIMWLAVSSVHFLEPAFRVIWKSLSWTGKRIICLGDYADAYPEGCLTPKEKAELEAKSIFEDRAIFEDFKPICRGWLSNCDYRLRNARSKHVRRRIKLLTKFLSQLEPFTVTDDHVLRNLTTKEYVRASKVEEMQHLSRYPFNLGTVILSQICWSSDPSVSMRCPYDIHRGLWAGHRFDIITVNEVDDMCKDVSVKITQMIIDTYEQDA